MHHTPIRNKRIVLLTLQASGLNMHVDTYSWHTCEVCSSWPPKCIGYMTLWVQFVISSRGTTKSGTINLINDDIGCNVHIPHNEELQDQRQFFGGHLKYSKNSLQKFAKDIRSFFWALGCNSRQWDVIVSRVVVPNMWYPGD